jgi:hypothetical protein
MAYKLFGLTGALLSSALAGLFAVIWTTLSLNMIQAGEQLGGTIIGLFAALFGIAAIKNLWQAVVKMFALDGDDTTAEPKAGPQAPEQFDPDTALARYMAKREQS